VGPRASLETVVKRKIPSFCRNLNPQSSSPCTTELSQLVPRSRMRGAIPPLPNTISWRCFQLKNAGYNSIQAERVLTSQE